MWFGVEVVYKVPLEAVQRANNAVLGELYQYVRWPDGFLDSKLRGTGHTN